MSGFACPAATQRGFFGALSKSVPTCLGPALDWHRGACVFQLLGSLDLISTLREKLFSARPVSTLYHYTSLQGLMGIIESRQLRASELRYMNDSTELLYAVDLLQTAITARAQKATDDKFLLSNFSHWLHNHTTRGPMLFSASFRANGN